MTKEVLNLGTFRCSVAAVLGWACMLTTAAADPIILGNRTAALGTATVDSGGVVTRSSFESPAGPLTGFTIFGDVATASASGASSRVSAFLETSIGPSLRIRGDVRSTLSSPNTQTTALANVFSGGQVDFRLTEAHTFQMFASFLAETSGPSPALDMLLSASLFQRGVGFLFEDTLTGGADSHVTASGDRTFERSGILGAGEYTFSAVAPILSATTPDFLSRGDRLAFDTAFSLAVLGSPEPVPEPGTLALLGAGLVALAGRARHRAKARQRIGQQH
jgi:PEP-CTERM motif-containing protein